MRMENDKSLQNLNTFHIDASAKYYTEASTNEELLDILSDKKMKEEKNLFLAAAAIFYSQKILTGLLSKIHSVALKC